MKISVGICAHNEENNIGRILEDVINQNFRNKYELVEAIMVASGRTDKTVKTACGISRKEHD